MDKKNSPMDSYLQLMCPTPGTHQHPTGTEQAGAEQEVYIRTAPSTEELPAYTEAHITCALAHTSFHPSLMLQLCDNPTRQWVGSWN